MNNYIKEAVELCDGWEFDSPHRIYIRDTPHWWSADEPPQYLLDALAAQLTRQVLAAGFDITNEIQGSHFEAPGQWIVIHDPVRSERHRFEYDARDPENENTIRAIINSGVLENE